MLKEGQIYYLITPACKANVYQRGTIYSEVVHTSTRGLSFLLLY